MGQNKDGFFFFFIRATDAIENQSLAHRHTEEGSHFPARPLLHYAACSHAPAAPASLWRLHGKLQYPQTCDSSRSRSTGEKGRGRRRGEGWDSSGLRRGFSVPPSSLSCSRVSPRGSSAAVSSSPGLSRMRGAPGGGGGRRGAGGRGGGGGGPGAGAVPSTGSGGGRGEEVRDKARGEQVRERGSGEQVRDGCVGVEGREMECGGERLLRRPHCSRLSLLLTAGATWGE